MPRSWISEDQAYDQDFASEDELTTVSGYLQIQHDAHAGLYDIHFPWQDVDDYMTTTSGYLHDHLKGRYIADVEPEDGQAYIWSEISQEWYPVNVADGFGVGYYYFQSHEDEMSTNSTDWINFMTLTVSGVESGEYRLGWYYEYRLSKTGKILYVRISLDDDLAELMHDVQLSMIRTINYVSSAGFYHKTLISGTHHIDVDWKINSALGGTTAYFRSVRLEFWRVN